MITFQCLSKISKKNDLIFAYNVHLWVVLEIKFKSILDQCDLSLTIEINSLLKNLNIILFKVKICFFIVANLYTSSVRHIPKLFLVIKSFKSLLKIA